MCVQRNMCVGNSTDWEASITGIPIMWRDADYLMHYLMHYSDVSLNKEDKSLLDIFTLHLSDKFLQEVNSLDSTVWINISSTAYQGKYFQLQKKHSCRTLHSNTQVYQGQEEHLMLLLDSVGYSCCMKLSTAMYVLP